MQEERREDERLTRLGIGPNHVEAESRAHNTGHMVAQPGDSCASGLGAKHILFGPTMAARYHSEGGPTLAAGQWNPEIHSLCPDIEVAITMRRVNVKTVWSTDTEDHDVLLQAWVSVLNAASKCRAHARAD